MEDEKKPPQGVEMIPVGKLTPTVRLNERLVEKLYALDNAFGVATRAARASGEMQLMQELEQRWDNYSAFISGPLSRVPAKLFE